MKNLFAQIKQPDVQSNAFDLSHEKKLTLDMGELVPIFCEEVVPGDIFKVNSECLVRMAPLIAPIMHRVNVFTHFFYVPNRILWRDWEDFITGSHNGKLIPQNELPILPHILVGGSNVGGGSYPANNAMDILAHLSSPTGLFNYLGLGEIKSTEITSESPDLKISILPAMAYLKIWYDHFRDENLTNENLVESILEDCYENGTIYDSTLHVPGTWETLTELQKRCWEKDYFTSALPWAQKGEEVVIPMSGGSGAISMSPAVASVLAKSAATGAIMGAGDLEVNSAGALTVGGTEVKLDPNETLDLDLVDTTTGINVNDLREATRLQKWLETTARAGSRYIEMLWAHFKVKSSDARLDRAEYLGGGKTPVVISEVLQTSATDETLDSAQGNMAGHGIAAGNTHGFKKRFEEHGYVIGIMSVMPRTTYSQGMRKMFLKQDKFDFYWPEFANLGEQSILNCELFNEPASIANLDTFGYQSRYSEYKFVPSMVHGDFCGNGNGLDSWHMARKFETLPGLDDFFVKADPTKRIYAVMIENTKSLYCQVYNNFKAIRPMPFFGTPQL